MIGCSRPPDGTDESGSASTDVNRTHTWGMKVAVAAALLVWSLTACAEEPAPEAASERECVPKIRLDTTTYTAAGYTEMRGRRFDTAEAAVCADEGPDPQGSVFTGHSEQVHVWSFPATPRMR
jgi:hypothetical protein